MKLKIDGEYKDVDFWSFFKVNFLVELFLTGCIYAILFIIGVIVTW
jgi:hypothetical protein